MTKILILINTIILTGCIVVQKSPVNAQVIAHVDKYKDRELNGKYINDSIGFSLDFTNQWELFVGYEDFPQDFRKFADLVRSQGAEIILIGMTVDQMTMVRVIVEETNLDVKEYFQLIEEINKNEVVSLGGTLVKINNHDVAEWEYLYNTREGQIFKFREYMIKNGKYNIRISFWTMQVLYMKLKERFQNVMDTYTLFPEPERI